MTGPGALRHRVQLQELQQVSDNAGGFTSNWVGIADLWASLEPAEGSEGVDAGRLAGRQAYDVVLRYRDGVRPAMRFTLGERIFEILTATNIGERFRWLHCLCEERDL